MAAWTNEETETLRRLHAAGALDKEIAAALPHRNANMVRQKRVLLGLAGNGVDGAGMPIKNRGPRDVGVAEKPFTVPALPGEAPPLSELLERRRREFERKRVAHEARKLIPVDVHLDGPIGIQLWGDPHVDDPGCDIGLIERHLQVGNETEGLFAGNVGDFTNNWIGRLAHLHSQQTTTAQEAWLLAEWLLRGQDWLFLVGGNHDAWSGAGDPLQWISRQQGSLLEPHGCRLELRLPSRRRVVLNARHDFKGHSQWNTAHGPAKAAQMGWRDHILACGHMHISGYQVVKDPSTGLISHALRVASYKVIDRYAKEMGLPDQSIFVCPVAIIDPAYGDDDPRFITLIFDPEEAAEYLTWKRSRWASGRAAA